MKSLTYLIGVLFISLMTSCAINKTQEQIDVAAQNERNTEKENFTKEQAEFLVLAGDARRMGQMQGMLGEKRATTQELKDYSKMLVTDQTILLDEIERLAAKKNIILLDKLSKKRQKGYEKLNSKEEGKPFDKELIKMTCIDHERDVEEFKMATNFKDKDFSKFASKFLPVIEKHLAEVQKLKENYDK